MTTTPINRNKTAEEIIREHYERLQREAADTKDDSGDKPDNNGVRTGTRKSRRPRIPASPVTITSIDDFVILKNIRCVGANGQVFEHYPELYVRKDVERKNKKKEQRVFTPYQAATYFEQKGLFLPSFALSCNIVAALFQAAVQKNRSGYRVKDADLQKVLNQYKDHGAGHGYHAQNTVVDWGGRTIIHYPHDSDFPEHGGSDNANQKRSQVRLSIPAGISDMAVADALKNATATQYLRNLTGLENPAVLVELGQYFERTSRLWTSSSSETRAAWLGCGIDSFSLNADNGLSGADAARGVRFGSPGGRAP